MDERSLGSVEPELSAAPPPWHRLSSWGGGQRWAHDPGQLGLLLIPLDTVMCGRGGEHRA